MKNTHKYKKNLLTGKRFVVPIEEFDLFCITLFVGSAQQCYLELNEDLDELAN